jgi:hypothetical protein
MLMTTKWPLFLACCLLAGGCTGTATPVPTSPTAQDFIGSVSYGGLTLGISDRDSSHDLGITFAPPNVVFTARVPVSGKQEAVDYLVSRKAELQDVFHVLGTQTNGTYAVQVPILRFKAGDYTIKAFQADNPTAFGQAALHITDDLLSR